METYTRDVHAYRFLRIILESQYTHTRERAAKTAEQEVRLNAFQDHLIEQEPLHGIACTNVSSCQIYYSDIRSRVECALGPEDPLGQLFSPYGFKATSVNIGLDPATSSAAEQRWSPDNSFQGRMASKLSDMTLIDSEKNASRDPPLHIERANPTHGPKSPSFGEFLRTLRRPGSRPSLPSLRSVSSAQSLSQTLHTQRSFASAATTLVEKPPRSLRTLLSRRHLNTSADHCDAVTDALVEKAPQT